MKSGRRCAWGGVAGPAGFVGAWVVAGALTERYSPVNDAISRLAAVHAPQRGIMTAGFVTFGVAVPLFGLALRDHLPGPAWMSAVGTGLATLGVAALPLDVSPAVDAAHGVAATAGYVTLAAVPLFAARPLARLGFRGAAAASAATGAASALCLAATVIGSRHGLFQRAGLTLGDAWVAATAVWILRTKR